MFTQIFSKKQVKILSILVVFLGAWCVNFEAAAAWFFWPNPDLWQTIGQADSLTSIASSNSRVEEHIHIYLRDKANIEQFSRNAEPYLNYIFQQVKLRHMPAELALLPIIESDYYPYELSRVGAEGMWQLMFHTAKDVGVTMNWWFDGRRDVVSSTQAALEYLQDTYHHYHDWFLTLAAYNAGPGTVDRAIRFNKKHHLPTDYWSLRLPQETKDYVPKLLAIAAIMQNPKKYHVKLAHVSSIPNYAMVTLDHQVNLQELAKFIHMDVMELLRLNPGFLHWVTPPGKTYTLIVPADKQYAVIRYLPVFTKNNLWLHYTVTKKDSLASIAGRYFVSADTLEHVNNLSSSHINIGQVLQIPIDYSQKIAMNEVYGKINLESNLTSNPGRSFTFFPFFKRLVLAMEKSRVAPTSYPPLVQNFNHLGRLISTPIKPHQQLAAYHPHYFEFDTHPRNKKMTHFMHVAYQSNIHKFSSSRTHQAIKYRHRLANSINKIKYAHSLAFKLHSSYLHSRHHVVNSRFRHATLTRSNILKINKKLA